MRFWDPADLRGPGGVSLDRVADDPPGTGKPALVAYPLARQQNALQSVARTVRALDNRSSQFAFYDTECGSVLNRAVTKAAQ